MMDCVTAPRRAAGEPLINQATRTTAGNFAGAAPCLAGQPPVRHPRRRHCPRRLPKGGVELTGGARRLCPAASLLNVSETGAGLAVPLPLEPGLEVELALRGHGHLRPVRLAAEVVWSAATADGRYRVGVKFQRRLSCPEWLAA
ncbi:MAG TPA: PilZ domain-containing protein [Gemmataceae bacterium]|nr:PilZ domain-containing protein [Gemmataceae bacterium]